MDGVDCGLMLCQLCFQESFVALDILTLEVDRGGDVEVMKKVGDMEEDGMAGLSSGQCQLSKGENQGRIVPLRHQTFST